MNDFDRDKASKCLEGVLAGYVHPEVFLDFVRDECVTPDPRVARIETLVASTKDWEDVNLPELRAILNGARA